MVSLETRWAKHRYAQERWKIMNRERYLQQKRELAARPSYLEHRRAMYRLRRPARSVVNETTLSTGKAEDDVETTDEDGNRPGACRWGGA